MDCHNNQQTIRAAPTHAFGSGSGDIHQVTLQITGTGGPVVQPVACGGDPGEAFSDCFGDAFIGFVVSGQPTAVSMSVSLTTSGTDCEVAVELVQGNATVLGRIVRNASGQTGSLPNGPFSPGVYSLQCTASGFSNNLETGAFSYNATVSVNAGGGTEFHWINPNGGAFATDTNWNLQQVPVSDLTHSDTAVFDLTNDAPVVITATNNAVARMVINRMNVGLVGSVRALGLANNFSFEVDNGGTLSLNGGSSLLTTNAVVGRQTGTESSVFVSGTNTKWSSTKPQLIPDKLLIGSGALGKVVVDHDGKLESDNNINVGGTAAGTLKVESGGQVHAPNCSLLRGSIQIRGRSSAAASALKIDSQLDLGGENGSGNMLIEAGGQVTANGVFVGDRTGNGGETLTIAGLDDAGNPSSLKVSTGGLTVARDAATQLEVKDGGELGTSGQVRIGANQAVGKLLVHGKSGSTKASWGHVGNAFVGSQNASSQLVVEAGGNVLTSDLLVVGNVAGDLGSASISGSDAQLTCRLLVVGVDGRGDLRISDGAAVVCTTIAQIGVSSQIPPGPVSLLPTAASGGAGVGAVIIENGPRSKLQVDGDCVVGFDEPGTVQLIGGGTTLQVVGTLLNQSHGVISGNGLLATGRLVNNGIISPHLSVINLPSKIKVANNNSLSPGQSPGVLSVEGNYEQTPDGGLNMEIAGLGDGQFDVLSITGDAALGGTLEVHMLDGFLLKAGDSVDFLLVGGSLTGDFAQIDFPELAPGFDAVLTFVDGKLRLTARNDAAFGDGTTIIPPADACGAGLCGAGTALTGPFMILGVLGIRRNFRRRRQSNSRRRYDPAASPIRRCTMDDPLRHPYHCSLIRWTFGV